VMAAACVSVVGSGYGGVWATVSDVCEVESAHESEIAGHRPSTFCHPCLLSHENGIGRWYLAAFCEVAASESVRVSAAFASVGASVSGMASGDGRCGVRLSGCRYRLWAGFCRSRHRHADVCAVVIWISSLCGMDGGLSHVRHTDHRYLCRAHCALDRGRERSPPRALDQLPASSGLPRVASPPRATEHGQL